MSVIARLYFSLELSVAITEMLRAIMEGVRDHIRDSLPVCLQIKGISRGGFGFVDLCENRQTKE